MTLYYADLLKDVILIAHFKQKMLPSNAMFDPKTDLFWLLVYYAMVGSVLLTELANAVTLHKSKLFRKMRTWKRVLSMLLSPLAPGVTHYTERRYRIDAEQCCKKSRADALPHLIHRGHACRRLRADFRANENAFEHSVQFTLLLLLIAVDRSSTRLVDSLAAVLLGDEIDTFLVLSSVLSCLSLVKERAPNCLERE